LENTLFNSFDNTSHVNGGSDPTEITDTGVLLSKIPIDPKCAKILVVASKYNLLHYGIMIVACMSVTELFDDDCVAQRVKEELPEIDNIVEDDKEGNDSLEESD
jgi:HrpA-like RNA helicase